MSVVSLNMDIMCPSKSGLPCASETVLPGGSYRIALSCKEALSEWERAASLFSEWASVKLFVSRTVFLLLDLMQLTSNSSSETFVALDMVANIRHVAFFAEPGINLIEALTVLTNFNHVETISIVLPGCIVEDTVSLNRHKILSTAHFLASLMHESPASTAQRTTTKPAGLYVECSTIDRKVEAFYTLPDAPSVRLVSPLCSEGCRHHQTFTSRSLGYSLFECT
jgi:hypothetical protein